VAENLLLRQQLAVLTRPTRERARLRGHDRLFWVLARRLADGWRRPTFQIVCRRPCGTMGVSPLLSRVISAPGRAAVPNDQAAPAISSSRVRRRSAAEPNSLAIRSVAPAAAIASSRRGSRGPWWPAGEA